MASARQVNLARIRFVARHLADLRETVAFLGGSVVGLLITDSAAPELRPTLDVDVIADVTSRSDYYRLEESLRSLGFTQSAVSGHPVCRWAIGEVIVDVMPTDESILGFSNHWYAPAIANAVALEIDEDLVIRVVTAPFFLAAKIEAFQGRGEGDYLASHDIEDIIAVVDGREEVVNEVRASDQQLRDFLSAEFANLLRDDDFRQSIPGHLTPDASTQARGPRIVERLADIVELS